MNQKEDILHFVIAMRSYTAALVFSDTNFSAAAITALTSSHCGAWPWALPALRAQTEVVPRPALSRG